MADQIVTNEVPATTTQFFCLFRLYETMLAAGWTHVESSRGVADTPSTSDRWAGAFGSLVGFAWIVLQANSGQQVVFRRGSTSTTDGWIVWLWDGGYVAGTSETDLLPSTLPAASGFIRGTGAAPNTYTTDGPWLGSTNTVDRLNIGCRDASGAGDESFWIIAKQTGASYTSTTGASVGRLALEALTHEAGLGISDPNEFAWWCPQSNTSSWVEGLDDLRCLCTEDNSGGTIGRWRRVWNAGQGSEELKLYGSGQLFMGDTGSERAGDAPGWDSAGDEAIYQATPAPLLRRVHLTKRLQVAFKDSEGGWTQNLFFHNESDSVNLDTFDGGTYAKFGNWLVVWWDGDSGNPPIE